MTTLIPPQHRTRPPLAALLALLVLAGATGRPAAGAETPPPCQASEHRQFDFWLGRWDVHLPDGSIAGENLIEAVLGGCALRESWQGRRGANGISLNLYDAEDRRWHQTWVDNHGGRLELAGTFSSGRMVLASEANGPARQRITWTPNADGSVRQLWETSTDAGKTWKTAFDGRYVRRR